MTIANEQPQQQQQQQEHYELSQAVEILKDRLFFASVNGTLCDTPNHHCFCTDTSLCYDAFFTDFGPLKLSCLFRFCKDLNERLKVHESKAIVYYCGIKSQHRSNSAAMIGAYQIIYMGKTPEEAYSSLRRMEPFMPFRDASMGPCDYNLTVLHCLQAVYKAFKFKFFDFDNFDPEEYEHFECVENGDLNVMVPEKFIAFSGPHRTKEGPNKFPQMIPEDYFPIWKRYGVKAVVRLNRKMYEEAKFIEEGYAHHDFFFVDGTTPTQEIVKAFLDACEQQQGMIAVHCKAGLGRTGTLIACYIMKHYKWTAEEAIAWLRICRPGSVIGPQQDFVVEYQQRMWEEGERYRRTRSMKIAWDEGKESEDRQAAAASVAKVARDFAKVSTSDLAEKRSERLRRQTRCRKEGAVHVA